MSTFKVTLEIDRVGDKEALAALDVLAAKAKVASGATDGVGTAAKNATREFGEHGKAVNKISRAMESLAVETLGAKAQVGLIGAELGKMALGTGAMIGILAGLAAVSAAYELITRDARAAEAAQKAALAALLDWNKAQHLGPGGTFGDQVSGAAAATARDSSQRSFLARAGSAVFGAGTLGVATGGLIGAYLRNTSKGFEEAKIAVREGQKALDEEVTKAFLERRGKETQILAQNIAANNATHAERRRALQMLKEDTALMQQYIGAGVSGELRASLGSQISGLQGALFPAATGGGTKAAGAAVAKSMADAYQRELARDLAAATKLAVQQGVEDAEVTYQAQHAILDGLLPTREQIAEGIRQVAEQIKEAIANDPVLRAADAAKQMGAQMGHMIADGIAGSLVSALDAGFEKAFSGSGAVGFIEGFGQAILGALGSLMEQMGGALISYGVAMAIFADGMTNPFTSAPAAIAAGAALVTLGAALNAAVRGHGGGGGNYSGGYSSSTGLASIIDRGIINPDTYSSRSAKDITPRQPVTVNATIIGKDDPNAQRQIAEIVTKAAQRGWIGAAPA